MVKLCCVVHCQNSSKGSRDERVTIHRFPKQNLDVQRRWLENSREYMKTNVKLENYGVCSLHFTPGDYIRPLSNVLHWYAVPTIFQGNFLVPEYA